MQSDSIPNGRQNQEAKQSSSFEIFFGAWLDTANAYLPLFKKAWGILLFLHLIDFVATQVFSQSAEFVRDSGREDVMLMILAASLELLFNLLWTTAWFLVIAHFLLARESRILERFSDYFQQVTIEQIRAMAAVLYRVPLLVVPALLQYMRLIMVPAVVTFDASYMQGEVDALKRSRALSAGRIGLFSLVTFITLLVPSLIRSIAHGDSGGLIWVNPVGALIGLFLTLFINTAFSIFLVAVYKRLSMMSTLHGALNERASVRQ